MHDVFSVKCVIFLLYRIFWQKKSKHKIKINQNVFNKHKIERENNRYFYENIFTFDNKKKEEKD